MRNICSINIPHTCYTTQAMHSCVDKCRRQKLKNKEAAMLTNFQRVLACNRFPYTFSFWHEFLAKFMIFFAFLLLFFVHHASPTNRGYLIWNWFNSKTAHEQTRLLLACQATSELSRKVGSLVHVVRETQENWEVIWQLSGIVVQLLSNNCKVSTYGFVKSNRLWSWDVTCNICGTNSSDFFWK